MNCELLIFRTATENDADFVVSAVINAEKSGTDKLGIAWLFDKNEAELREFLRYLLLENIEGSEYFLNGFLIAEIENQPVATFNGWVEQQNSLGLSSAMVKLHLYKQFLDGEQFAKVMQKMPNFQKFTIPREANSLQFEFAYTIPEFRGKNIMSQIIQEIIEHQTKLFPKIEKAQIQLLANNVAAIHSYEKAGFAKTLEICTESEEIALHFPNSTKILLEKLLLNK